MCALEDMSLLSIVQKPLLIVSTHFGFVGFFLEMANRIPDGETKVVTKSKATPPTWRIVAKDVILVQPEEAKANIAGPVIAFQRDREHIFVISGQLKGADKIVISAKETDKGVVKQEKAPFKHINLLGCISFTGIDYHKAELEKRSNYRAFSVKGRENICQMHVSFEYSTTQMVNKKERILKIEVHVKDQKKVFSHLFKVFKNRRLAIKKDMSLLQKRICTLHRYSFQTIDFRRNCFNHLFRKLGEIQRCSCP